MLDKEKLNKDLKSIEENAWRVESNTTINAMVTHIVKRVLTDILLPEVERLEALVAELNVKLDGLDEIDPRYAPANELKVKHNGSTNGRDEKPEWNEEALVKRRGRKPQEARTSLS